MGGAVPARGRYRLRLGSVENPCGGPFEGRCKRVCVPTIRAWWGIWKQRRRLFRGSNIIFHDPLRGEGNGSLAEAILHTLLHVVPGNACLGELPRAIPFAVVAGKATQVSSKASIAQGWVCGNLMTPRYCGDTCKYRVDACGDILEGKSANHAPVAAYLDVMTHGLKAANRWLDRLRSPDQPLPAPHPVSGRELRFGTLSTVPPAEPPSNLLAEVELVATPISMCGIEPRPRTAHRLPIRISQGELFQATVNLQAIRSALDCNRTAARHAVFWCRDDDVSDESEKVLIKVSSDACFDSLIPSWAAYLRHLKEKPWKADVALRKALSHSLLGVYRPPGGTGLVQLLPNVLNDGYTALSPHKWSKAIGGWGALWRAFAGLVREVLLPLAASDGAVVHADIRAGYDVTANILCHATTGSMRLIDLDSLCEFGRLETMSGVADVKYILAQELPDPLQSAIGFVLGQVICAALVWLEGILHNEVKANATISRGWQSLLEVGHPAVAAAAAAAADGVEDALVVQVLDHYQDKFERTFSLGRT